MQRLRVLILLAVCLGPHAAPCEPYEYSAALTLSFEGVAGPPISSQGVVDVTAGGVSGQKLISLTLPAGVFAASGNVLPPTSPGVTIAGLAITSAQYSIANEEIRVETVVTGMGPPSYGRLPLTGQLRLCAGGGCASSLSHTMFAIGDPGLAFVQGSDGTLIGAPPAPPASQFTSQLGQAWGVTSPPRMISVSHTSLSLGALQVASPSATVVGNFPAPLRYGPLMAASSTVQAGGLVQMVVPYAVVSDATGSLSGGTGHARLSIQLVPEPWSGIAFSSGALLLVALGYHRTRRR